MSNVMQIDYNLRCSSATTDFAARQPIDMSLKPVTLLLRLQLGTGLSSLALPAVTYYGIQWITVDTAHTQLADAKQHLSVCWHLRPYQQACVPGLFLAVAAAVLTTRQQITERDALYTVMPSYSKVLQSCTPKDKDQKYKPGTAP